MQRWLSRASLKLSVDDQHVADWENKNTPQVREEILREFNTTADRVRVEVFIRKRQKINVELRAISQDPKVDALKVVNSLERKFFGLKIYRREICYEEK